MQLLQAPLQARRSQVQFPMGVRPATQWPQAQLSLLTEMSTSDFSWGLRQLVHRLTAMPPSCADVPRSYVLMSRDSRSLNSLEHYGSARGQL